MNEQDPNDPIRENAILPNLEPPEGSEAIRPEPAGPDAPPARAPYWAGPRASIALATKRPSTTLERSSVSV